MKKLAVYFFLFTLIASCSGFADTSSPPPPAFAPDQPANGLIVLLNDYGDQDFYVGALKGAIYSKFLDARIDDITDEVPQYNIREGAYILAHSATEFPPGTVFCVVVDPGVGSKRKPIAVETDDGRYYVAPDNGVLTFVLQQSKVKEAREITNPLFMRDANSLSSTFHGRDVFGPASAELAKGVPIQLAGPPLPNVATFQEEPPTLDGGRLNGEVDHVDWYGNVHTNIPRDMLDKLGATPGRVLRIHIGSESVNAPLVNTYSDVRDGDWLAVINSAGVLEIARNQASANAILQIAAGTRVSVNL